MPGDLPALPQPRGLFCVNVCVCLRACLGAGEGKGEGCIEGTFFQGVAIPMVSE